MRHRQKRIIAFVSIFMIATVIAGIGSVIVMNRTTSAPKPTRQTTPTKEESTPAPQKAYRGNAELVTSTFTVKVPNGWTASIADTGNFRGIMFARPEKLDSLIYNNTGSSMVDRNGFPIPNGLTEHFFILAPTSTQTFNPADHREVTSSPFTFDDGTAGMKYYVVKHADEARQYGGLLRDSEWRGRTYIYEKNSTRVEAHLALYPSSNVDTAFYESAVRSITLN